MGKFIYKKNSREILKILLVGKILLSFLPNLNILIVFLFCLFYWDEWEWILLAWFNAIV